VALSRLVGRDSMLDELSNGLESAETENLSHGFFEQESHRKMNRILGLHKLF
jgi:hypothetical protein